MKNEKSGPVKSPESGHWSWKSADFWPQWSWKMNSAARDALIKQFCKYTYNCKCYNLCFLCAHLHLGPKLLQLLLSHRCSRPEMMFK